MTRAEVSCSGVTQLLSLDLNRSERPANEISPALCALSWLVCGCFHYRLFQCGWGCSALMVFLLQLGSVCRGRRSSVWVSVTSSCFWWNVPGSCYHDVSVLCLWASCRWRLVLLSSWSSVSFVLWCPCYEVSQVSLCGHLCEVSLCVIVSLWSRALCVCVSPAVCLLSPVVHFMLHTHAVWSLTQHECALCFCYTSLVSSFSAYCCIETSLSLSGSRIHVSTLSFIHSPQKWIGDYWWMSEQIRDSVEFDVFKLSSYWEAPSAQWWGCCQSPQSPFNQ